MRGPEPRLLNIAELCATLGVCRSTGYELVREGAIPSMRIGKAIRIPVSALEDWIRRRAQ